MRITDLFSLAIKALMDRKVRSVLTVLGIMIGGAIIMALVASSSGLSAGVNAQVSKIGASTLIVRAQSAIFSSGGQSQYMLSAQDTGILQRIPDVTLVIPYYSKSVAISLGGQVQSGTLYGMDLTKLAVLYKGLSLMTGSFPTVGDPTSAVIGNGVAFPVTTDDQLIFVNQAISMKIGSSTSGLTFLVKGILAPYGSVTGGGNIDNNVYVSFQAAEILLKTPYYSGFYVIADIPDNVPSVQAAIQSQYGGDVNVFNAGAMVASVTAITGQMTVFLGSIGAVSLFVAAVGIANTMYVSVMERTREIGVLKALGYKGKQIMSMFLSEAVVTGIMGGLLGTLLGYVLAFALGGQIPLSSLGRGFGGRGGSAASATGAPAAPPIFTPELILFSLIFPILISVVAGLYPAWRASKMNPITALKYE